MDWYIHQGGYQSRKGGGACLILKTRRMERVSGEARNRWHVSLPLNHSLEQKERQIAESSQFRVDQLSNEYFNQKNFLIGVDE